MARKSGGEPVLVTIELRLPEREALRLHKCIATSRPDRGETRPDLKRLARLLLRSGFEGMA